eukprot:754877-Hanusia_phi.AAC.1
MSYETNPLYAIAHESIYCSGAGAVGTKRLLTFLLPLPLFLVHVILAYLPHRLCLLPPSRWSAQRIMQEKKEFDYKEKLRDPKGKVTSLVPPPLPHCAINKIFFTAEHIFDWMYEDYLHLQGLRPVTSCRGSDPSLLSLRASKSGRSCTTRRSSTLVKFRQQVERGGGEGKKDETRRVAKELQSEEGARLVDGLAAAVYYDDMYVERALSEQTAQEIGQLQPSPLLCC